MNNSYRAASVPWLPGRFLGPRGCAILYAAKLHVAIRIGVTKAIAIPGWVAGKWRWLLFLVGGVRCSFVNTRPRERPFPAVLLRHRVAKLAAFAAEGAASHATTLCDCPLFVPGNPSAAVRERRVKRGLEIVRRFREGVERS